MGVFIENINTLLRERHLTKKELSEEIGIRRTTLSDWEKNGAVPAGDILLKIAKKFDVSMEYLITGEQDNQSEEERFLIKIWRTLTAEQKQTLNIMLEGFQRLNAQSSERASG